MKNKCICQLAGRLGNQLFEIATALSYAKQHGMEFYIRENDCIKSLNFLSNQPNYYNRYDFLLKKFNVIDINDKICAIRFKESYHQDYMNFKDVYDNDVYFDGIWQSSDYFKDYQFVRDALKIDKHYSIDFSDSVGMSIRMGDYLKFKDDVIIPTVNWYENAYHKFFEGKQCIVSSDDIQWCKANLHIKDAIFISGKAEYCLHIMSLCKHHILSNSTFSWWTAFLNEQCNSKTIYPSQFWKKPNLFYRDNFWQKNWTAFDLNGMYL